MMPWVGDTFLYSSKLLRVIAENYVCLYDGIPTWQSEITRIWDIAEFKADFDMALDAIGTGDWHGIGGLELKSYIYFDRIQQSVIADILQVEDRELARCGFYDISRLRVIAYSRMKSFLNGG